MITICDTGPLVAYLNRNDPHHPWAISIMKQVRPPMLTCEPVLTEAVYFLREDGMPVDPLFQLLERDALRMDFDMSTHWPRVRTLMARYPERCPCRRSSRRAVPGALGCAPSPR